jgi:hypothetical protein
MAAARSERPHLDAPAAGRLAVTELLPKVAAQLRQLAHVAAVRRSARFVVLCASRWAWSRCGCPPGRANRRSGRQGRSRTTCCSCSCALVSVFFTGTACVPEVLRLQETPPLVQCMPHP